MVYGVMILLLYSKYRRNKSRAMTPPCSARSDDIVKGLPGVRAEEPIMGEMVLLDVNLYACAPRWFSTDPSVPAISVEVFFHVRSCW